MLDAALDIFRLRQYFNVITRAREVVAGAADDIGFLADSRRALLPLPFDSRAARDPAPPFPSLAGHRRSALEGRRVAIAATGGSGALASIVGVARALEEHGVTPVAISVCSGSSLFGVPLAAGMPPDEVARFTLSLQPADYLDLDGRGLLRALATAGRGFTGLLRGDAVEATYRRLLGDRCLGDLPIRLYAPVWNVDHNTVEYLGPETHPNLPAARLLRMAIALPLFIQAAEMDGAWWSDGGVVDILPVAGLLDRGDTPDLVLAVNGFYPPGFAGEDVSGWHDRALSILYEAAQVRTCQQVQLARVNLQRLRDACEVILLEPVPYTKVRGTGFYRQFFDTAEWPSFMAAGHRDAMAALARLDTRRTAA